MRLHTAATSAVAILSVGSVAASPAQDYMLYCMGCHGTEAQGVPGKVPPLAHALGRFLRSPEGRNYVLRVPGAANSALSDEQLAGVLNWLVATFNSADVPDNVPRFSTEEVAHLRHVPLPGVQAARNDIVKSLAATGPAPPTTY